MTTGDIYKFIINDIKIRITENLIIGNKNPSPGLTQMLQMWMGQNRQFYIEAKSEANWAGLSKDFTKKMYAKNRQNQNRYNLPK